MQLQLRDGLPFCQVVVSYKQKQIVISNVLIDTGSARTIFSADVLRDIGITPQPNDVLEVVRGVGGSELVYTRSVDFVQIESRQVAPCFNRSRRDGLWLQYQWDSWHGSFASSRRHSQLKAVSHRFCRK